MKMASVAALLQLLKVNLDPRYIGRSGQKHMYYPHPSCPGLILDGYGEDNNFHFRTTFTYYCGHHGHNRRHGSVASRFRHSPRMGISGQK